MQLSSAVPVVRIKPVDNFGQSDKGLPKTFSNLSYFALFASLPKQSLIYQVHNYLNILLFTKLNFVKKYDTLG